MQIKLFQEIAHQEPISITGLIHIPSYISQADERHLIDIIDKKPWMNDLKRRVQHYGYKYDYKARIASPELKIGPLPDWIEAIANKLFAAGLVTQIPDQVIVNEYLPGQGISTHVDCIPCFGDEIVSLSLAGSCVMAFCHTKTKIKTSILLEPCDLLILSGTARYEWQHGIPARKSDKTNGQYLARKRRISLTFRKMILA